MDKDATKEISNMSKIDCDEDTFEMFWDKKCLEAEHLFISTKNPMYAWRVLGSYARQKLWFESTIQLPTWCIQYLATCSDNLSQLAAEKSISDRHSLISETLGLSYKRWSAFTDEASRNAKDFDLQHFQWLKGKGHTTREALEKVMEDRGITDERTMLRRFSEAKGAVRGGRSKPVRAPMGKLRG